MHPIKRLLAVCLIVICVAVLIVCLGGAVGVWVVQRPLHDAAERIFADSDRALKVTARSVALVEDGLRKASADLATVKETAATTANNGTPPGLWDRMAARALADHLGPKVGQVNETVNMATDAAIVMNSLLGGLSQVPQSSIGVLDTDRLSQVHDSLTEFTGATQKLSAMLQQTSPDANAGDLSETTSHMEELLAQIIAWVVDFRSKLADVHTHVSLFRSQTQNWIRIGPYILTAVFVWVALSQLAFIAWLRSWFKASNR